MFPPAPAHRYRSRLSSLLASLTIAAGLLAVAPAPIAAGATWTAPGYVRSFGGRGEAGVYAWGMAYNPITNEILAGDYWNFYIRRYDLNGNPLGSFFRPVNQRRGQPYSISVDGRPGKGDIYVSEISDTSVGWFAHYTAQGQFVNEFNTGARYTAWHTIAGHYLYVSDAHYWSSSQNPPKVRVYDLDNNDQQVLSFGSFGTSPNTGQMGDIHGIGVDAGGRIYVADATNRDVHVFTSNGTFLYDVGSPGKGVGQFTGDIRGLAIDQASGGIYVVDANDGQIEKFQMSADPATTPQTAVGHWGTVGTGPGQMGDGGRGIAVDGEGNIWVADYGNYRLLKFSPSGTVLGTFPDPAMPPTPGGFSWARDVAIDPQGNVWAADARNNRFQKFDPNGAFLGTWGRRNSDPPYGLDYPRGIGVDPTTGNVWVSSTRDHFIRVYDSSANYLGTAGNGQDSTATGSFRWPLDVEFVSQGGTEYAWIADYTSGRLKRVDAAPPFTERQSISITNNGVTVDPATGRLYVVSWRNDNVSVYDGSGGYITRWGSSGSGPCQFTNPWDIDLVNGTLYVTDSDLNRVTAFTTGGTCLGSWGTKGTGPYQLKDPSGITHDAQGNIYVADANNDRVVEYSFSVPLPDGSDSTSPTISISSPTVNQVLPASPVTISGTATDDVGVASVFIAVKDRVTNRWWDTKDGIWATARTWNYAAVVSPDVGSVTYAGSFTAEAYGGSYTAQAESMDTSGHAKVSGTVNFKVQGSGPIDTTAPTVSISSPTTNQVVPVGPIQITGAAADDVGVATVEVAIRDRVSGSWWQPGTGTWGANLKWFSVGLGTPGGSTTTWSTTWNDAVSGGSYRVQTRATDTSDNISVTPYPWIPFTVS